MNVILMGIVGNSIDDTEQFPVSTEVVRNQSSFFPSLEFINFVLPFCRQNPPVRFLISFEEQISQEIEEIFVNVHQLN